MLARFRVSRSALFPLLLLGLAAPAIGQDAAAPPVGASSKDVVPLPLAGVDHSAWLYKGSDITPDPDWHFGTLPNGVRYAVRNNGVPPGQVSVRVRIDAGSLYETDSQRGFAHLIEHLTFRSSKYVADGEAKRVWQRMGTTFGVDSNAITGFVSTTYRLDLPSATTANVDETLKIMSGMVEAPIISDTTLNEERPVVLAEQREQPGPQVRWGDALRATFFAGQPLADRSPIGSIKTLEAATPASVEAFHDAWYRPERALVIVSGDMDPETAARLIEKNFASWKGIGPAPADPDFGKPDPTQPKTAALVEPGLPDIVAMGVLRPWHFNADTVIFNQKRMVDTLAAQIISRRLETRARAGGSFLQASVDLDDESRSVNGTFVNIVPIGDDWVAAVKDVRAVIADAMAKPPTQADIDRELAAYDTALRTQVETAKVEAGAQEADDLVSALDIRETVTTPATAYSIFQDARKRGMFTPAAILASTKRIFQGVATRALVNTQKPDDTAKAKLAAALSADVSKLAGKRVQQAAVSFAKLPKLGAPGKVVSREVLDALDMEKVTLANGVRAILYPNSGESGRVYVEVRFGGGYNALPADHPTPAWAGDMALVASGVGALGQDDLDALTSGRRIGMDFDIDDSAFTLSAITSPDDYPDQLRLMVAKLAYPNWDPNPVIRARAAMLTSYGSYDSSPDGVLARDLEGLLRSGDPRWKTPTPGQIKALTPAAFKSFWAPYLASGPIEVDIFGDFKEEDALKALTETFGAMKPRAADTKLTPPPAFPAHDAQPVIRSHDGPENQAEAVIAWPTGGGVEGIVDSRNLDVLAQIFTDRLFEEFRQGTGLSYSPNVASQWPIGTSGGGRLIAMGQVPPNKVDLFIATARKIAADLVAHPVSDDELQRLLGSYKQAVARASSGNQFWLQQMDGAAYDPRIAAATLHLSRDLTNITAASLQAVAAKYLKPDKDWTMVVVPEKVATALREEREAPAVSQKGG